MSWEVRNRYGRNPQVRSVARHNREEPGEAGPAPRGTFRKAAKYHLAQAGVLARRDQPVARAAVAGGRRRARIALAAATVAMIVALIGLAARHMASLGGASGGGTAAGAGSPAATVPGGGVEGGGVAGDAVPATAGLAAATPRDEASAWVATQVSGRAMVACDPAMCAALAARGFPALGLTLLRHQAGQTGPDLGDADLVVATATVRNEFGSRLASRYAPAVIATFGAGAQQVQVRAVARDGAAAYLAAADAGLTARKAAGSRLLRDPSLRFSPAARAQIAAGRVDGRLLTMLDSMAAAGPVQVTSFGDPDPGGGAWQPLRSVSITASPANAQASGLHRLLAFARDEGPPCQAARVRIVAAGRDRGTLVVEFTAPSPLGAVGPVGPVTSA